MFQDVSPMRRKGEKCQPYITVECKKLAQNQYKNWRHDKVAQDFHWILCNEVNLQRNETRYDHSPGEVIQNDHVELMWGFRI